MSPEIAHYLGTVMRRKPGDMLRVFNGRDGEWLAEIADLGKRGGALICRDLLREQVAGPDLWLMFAPVKRARTDFIIEKAVEMGVARICPVFTDHTNSERVRPERMVAQVREAAEQCGRLDMPEIAAAAKLSSVLAEWDPERALIFADEGRAGAGGGAGAIPAAPAAVLIGPEGGFSEPERRAITAISTAVPVALGPRILRADTAAVAALTMWQMAAGDWQ